MSQLNHYHVVYQWLVGGKPIAGPENIHVACADSNPSTIKTAVTTTAGKSYPGGTFDLIAVHNMSSGEGCTN